MADKRTIDVRPRSYQPNKSELEEVFRIDATPGQLAKALLRDVEVRETPATRSRTRVRG